MNKEDYSKYYIQGSDHYLIPKDVFDELFEEMENWREEAKELKKHLEEYKLITIDYQELEARNQELKKELEEYKRLGFEHLNDKCNKLENQQKDFIEYMNKTIKELECDDVGDEELKGYLIQEIDTFKEILSKYKESGGNNVEIER